MDEFGTIPRLWSKIHPQVLKHSQRTKQYPKSAKRTYKMYVSCAHATIEYDHQSRAATED
eukprot:4101344-Amphidinium_carterae.1